MRKHYVIVDDSEPRPALYHVQVGPAFPMRHEMSHDLGRAAWFMHRASAIRRLVLLRHLGIERPGFRIVPIDTSKAEVLGRLQREAAASTDGETTEIFQDCAALIAAGGR